MSIKVDIKDIKLEKSTLAALYVKYKGYGLYILIFIICIFLFLQFIVPQFQEFLVSKDEEKQYEKRIQTLRSNIQLLTSLDEQGLDKQVDVLSAALPIEKDFAGIINAIATASDKTGVAIGDFTFSLGDLSVKGAGGDASVVITLKVNGSAIAIKNFMKDLSEMVPITDITTITYSQGTASMLTSFIYRPPSSIKFNLTSSLQPLTSADLAIVAKAEKWKGNVGTLFDFFPDVVSTTPQPTPTVQAPTIGASSSSGALTPSPTIVITPTP